MPPALKTIVDPSGTDLMNALSAAETSLAPLASIEDGTLTVRVVTGAGKGREPDGAGVGVGAGVGWAQAWALVWAMQSASGWEMESVPEWESAWAWASMRGQRHEGEVAAVRAPPGRVDGVGTEVIRRSGAQPGK